MGLFGKKKEEVDIEEDGLTEEEILSDKKLTRKFRDLNPENKKKRKEPPKPWGKKERIIVLAAFLITTLSATLMFLVSHDFKLPGLPSITLNGINFKNPFGEEIIEIGQKKNLPQNDIRAETAISLFDQKTKPLSGLYGLYVIRLSDGTSYGVSTSTKFQGASLIKLPLMILMYKMSESGTLDLNTKYVLRNEDKVKGAGVLYNTKAGTVYTYRQLAEFMGKDSDRTAYKVIKDVITDTTFNNFLVEMGMTNTDFNSGETTPSDIGNLFQKLWSGNLVNSTDKAEILADLTNTSYENWIAKGVPKGVTVAHKFGQDEGVMADGGIVLTPNPYILVIMGNGITRQDADALFPQVSRDIYNTESTDE